MKKENLIKIESCLEETKRGKQEKNKQRGITLIALVVTIIILLILTGITLKTVIRK